MMSVKPTPTATRPDVVDGASRDAEGRSDLGPSAGGVPDSADHLSGQLGAWVPVAAIGSPIANPVSLILEAVSPPEVAEGVVECSTGAVAAFQPFRAWADEHLQNQPVDPDLACSTSERDLQVAVGFVRSENLPWPTLWAHGCVNYARQRTHTPKVADLVLGMTRNTAPRLGAHRQHRNAGVDQ
jgi:hypothetical protein